MDPFKICIVALVGPLAVILVSLVFAAAMAGHWLTAIAGGIGIVATICLIVETLRS